MPIHSGTPHKGHKDTPGIIQPTPATKVKVSFSNGGQRSICLSYNFACLRFLSLVVEV